MAYAKKLSTKEGTEGRAAGAEASGYPDILKNPYVKDSEQYNLWIDGWVYGYAHKDATTE